jgi:endonuclease/exonuclease/phosphatase (EEP) superfamily protein YafD
VDSQAAQDATKRLASVSKVASQPTTSRWRGRTAALLTVASVGLLLSTAIALALGTHWWVAELLTNLPVQHALTFTVLLLAGALLRQWRLTALAAIGLAVNLAIVVPVVSGLAAEEPPPPAEGASSLEVTFHNTKYRVRRVDARNYLAERHDDVVVLSLPSDTWATEIEQAAFGLVPRAGRDTGFANDLELLVLVRDPDARVIVHRPTEDPRDAILQVDLVLDGELVHVLAAHPVSPLTPTRAAQRDRMLERLTMMANELPGPVVVVGDLNATPWSPRLQALLDGAELVDSQLGHGLQPSYPATRGRLGLAIDHVLHTDEFTTIERELGPAFGSDHRMVHARLALRGSAKPPR